MTQLFDHKASCFGCGACQAACPAGAIAMTADGEGFSYPVVNPQMCTGCGSCTAVCPGKAPIPGRDGTAFALRCRDMSLLKSSSSGGAFSLLAQKVLDRGGLVCGAVFDEAFRVQHILSDRIAPMRKSKYVQSDLTGVYESIRQALTEGRQVLFTGTPCQCDGIRHFLGTQPEGLILAALVCRGVQSPGLWKDYVNHISRDGRLLSYCFRDKRSRNNGHTVAYATTRGEEAVSMGTDAFSRLYMKCLTFRPSCYQCPYTRWELPFDLTIGDFWGIENTHPELNDGLGTSLVIVRSEKGRQLLESVRDQALVLETGRQASQQPALLAPAKMTILRKLLFQDYSRKGTGESCDMALILKKYGG